MPEMSGHQLIQRLKSDISFNEIPIIIVSSIITDENRDIGEQLGVNSQISKPEIGILVDTIEKYLSS